jgi:3-oxoacyl-[acyl-carrier-protein] synthase II
MSHRVVVTGMGVVSCLGHDFSTTWAAIKAGCSGLGPLQAPFAHLYTSAYYGAVQGWDAARYMDFKDARRMDIHQQYAFAAAAEAMRQAGLAITDANREGVSVIVGTSTGGHASYDANIRAIEGGGPRRVSPFAILQYINNGAAALLSIAYGAQGPSFAVVSSCATGADNIGQAYRLIREGAAVAAIAGAADYTLSNQGFASLERIGVLSHWQGPPAQAMRPFSRDRDGLILSSGAGILVLESLTHARRRGAQILAELIGYGNSADAYHLTAPDEDGKGGALAMTRALKDAKIAPSAIHYINAHGTATRLNDLIETRAMKRALGPAVTGIPISSTKPLTGHAMGATAAIEAAICIQAIREGFIPATPNLSDQDAACDLDYVPNQPRQQPVSVAMTNALGLGGHNASLIFRAFAG